MIGWEEASWGLLPIFLCLPWVVNPGSGFSPVQGTFLTCAALMAGSDLASRRIPNKLNALAAVCGLAWSFSLGGLTGLGQAALGGLVCFALMAVFFFLGMIGAGDVKAVAALGTFLVPWAALNLFLMTVLMGGALGLGFLALRYVQLAAVRSLRVPIRMIAREMTMPYGLAIFAAALTLAAQGGLS